MRNLSRKLIKRISKVLLESLDYHQYGDNYSSAKIKIGKYQYEFAINKYPPEFIDLSEYNIHTHAGLRLDVMAVNSNSVSNDLHDQEHYLRVMKLIYSELERLAKNNNIFIVNSKLDSRKRDSIYDRWAKNICNKYHMRCIKIENYPEETIRYLHRK